VSPVDAFQLVCLIMATLDDMLSIESGPLLSRSRRSGRWIVVGAPFAGAGLGVVARGWMRLITDDAEFSWSGTIFIIVAFAIAGAGHGVAWVVRRAGVRRRWSTTARVVAGVSTLPLFMGAGGMMLPTVFGASVASARTAWPRTARLAAALVAIPIPIIIGLDLVDRGLTPGVLLGMVLMIATYAVVVRSSHAIAAPIADGWRLPRIVRVVIAVALVIAVLLIVVLAVGL
jgi:hypothetical protein